MEISFIGAGNVAWHLSRALENAGNSVNEIFSRNPENAQELASFLFKADIQEDLDFSNSPSEIFFVCIPELAYSQVLPELILPENSTLVLVTGTYNLSEALFQFDPNRETNVQVGIIYPLHSFVKRKNISLLNVPLFIEASHRDMHGILFTLAKQISNVLYEVSPEERKKIHLASLFSSEFSRFLWEQSKSLLKDLDLDQTLLEPLLKAQIAGFMNDVPQELSALKNHYSDDNLYYQQRIMLEGRELQEIYNQMIQIIRNY
ncbi:MAG: hypothetical protein RIR51_1904 [Bacteroidota bacterium]|jgi:predicted short-subunit dehydrogenase-like oxidoreductase (DUF2520 family)